MLSFWQLLVQTVTWISPKWNHFCFSDWMDHAMISLMNQHLLVQEPSNEFWWVNAITSCIGIIVLYDQYNDVIISSMASQITCVWIVYSTVCSDADQRKHQSSASLAFVRGIHLVTGEFPAQRDSITENVSIWWRHHVISLRVVWPCRFLLKGANGSVSY